MTPLGWIAIYNDGAGGEIIHRSTDGGGKAPKDLPRSNCLGVRTIYAETVSIDDGPDIHYSDVWLSHDWIVFYEDGRDSWRCRNADADDSTGREEGREGVLLPDARWDQVVRDRFMNNDDTRVGRW